VTKRPCRRRTWMVQWYSPGCASVYPPNTCLLNPTRVHNPNCISIGSVIFAPLMAYCCRTCPGIKTAPSPGAIWTHIQYTVPLDYPSAQPKQYLNRFSCFCTAQCKVSYFTMGQPFSPHNSPFPLGICTPI